MALNETGQGAQSARYSRDVMQGIVDLLSIGIRNTMVPEIMMYHDGRFNVSEGLVKQIGEANGLSNPRKGAHPFSSFKDKVRRAEATIFLRKFDALKKRHPDTPDWRNFINAYQLYERVASQSRFMLNSEVCWCIAKMFAHRSKTILLDKCHEGHIVARFNDEIIDGNCPLCHRTRLSKKRLAPPPPAELPKMAKVITLNPVTATNTPLSLPHKSGTA